MRPINLENLGYSKEQRRYFQSVKSNAKRRGIDFDLKIKDVYTLLVKQNYKCAMTGDSITVMGKEYAASIDRIDSALPYTKKNIHWVHKEVNKAKNVLSKKDFINLCGKITAYYCKLNN